MVLDATEMELILRDGHRDSSGEYKSLPQVLRSLYASFGSSVFTPTEPDDWTFEGTVTLQDALDAIGTRLSVLEAAAQDAGQITYVVSVDGDWPDPNPAFVADALDDLAARLNILEP